MFEEKITCILECVLTICTRHPKPTPNSMSEGNTVKEAVDEHVHKLSFYSNKHILKNKDTENDASKAGRYGHPWVTLSGNGDVRKTV